MRALVVYAVVGTVVGCASREHPYRFASPMLGMATVPPEPLRAQPVPRPGVRGAAIASAATAVASAPATLARSHLPSPHRLPVDSLPPPARSPDELRGLVGRRDKRSSIAAAIGWSRDLGAPIAAANGSELVDWAEREHRAIPEHLAEPGDLLVFDRATGDDPADLVALAIGRDARGVLEFVYLGGGVVRRGFVDRSRPALRRDGSGAVVNTYLRHGKRYPPPGTRYLAGELLSHAIRARLTRTAARPTVAQP